ncbi:MAG TPA: hypothetical protein PKB09_03630 [Candidatus Saccharibacteria bacterium]|nr:hypothetical protein [Candidatus Saccharibacteria bacterium]
MAKQLKKASKASKTSTKKQTVSAKPADKLRRNVLISAIIAGVFIIVANTAIWINRYMFNSENFTTTAVTSLTSESSRTAIATEITDQALKDYPKIKSVVDDTAVNFISSLLDSNRTEKVLTGAVSRLQIFLTSPKREPVVINLTTAKEVISRLIEVSGREDEARIDPASIPDQITIFNPDNFPNFYGAGVTLSWLSPLLGLSAIALLAWPYVKNRDRYKELLVLQGVCVAIFGFLALLIGPLVRPVVLGNIQSANMRVVVGNLYSAFTAAFNAQSYVIIAVGLIAVATSLGITALKRYRTK